MGEIVSGRYNIRPAGDTNRNDRSNSSSRGRAAGMDHDEELHESVIDITGCGRLEDEDILITNRFADRHTRLLVGVVKAHGVGNLNAQAGFPKNRQFFQDSCSIWRPIISSPPANGSLSSPSSQASHPIVEWEKCFIAQHVDVPTSDLGTQLRVRSPGK